MKARSVIYLMLLFLTFSIAISYANSMPVAGIQDWAINETEIPKLEAQASLGSGEAALRLSRYYSAVMLDQKRGEYWLSIAAENGDETAQANYAYNLADQQDRKSQLRAIYWAKKVAASKDKKSRDWAKNFLKEHPNP